jgi:hypothetical protein
MIMLGHINSGGITSKVDFSSSVLSEELEYIWKSKQERRHAGWNPSWENKTDSLAIKDRIRCETEDHWIKKNKGTVLARNKLKTAY